MSLIKTISDSAPTLTPNERLLIQSVIDNPTTAALGTASELAKAVGVHEATASRLAKNSALAVTPGFETPCGTNS